MANLSIMLVPSYQNQVKEAYRVLAPGSIACFTTWGNKAECAVFTTIEEVVSKYMTPE